MDTLEQTGSTVLRVRRTVIYLVWTLALMPVQAIGLILRQPWTAQLPRFYHRVCCRILGYDVRQIGEPVSPHPVLFASNHVSYTDITVLGSLIPGSFVAKSEIAGWPFFGWLAKLQRSVFVDRQVRSTARQRDAIAERLAAGDALILFPEGTSSDGIFVLPFKSALFSVVFNKEQAITVQPVSLAYTRLDGMPIGRRLRPFFAWYGDMDLAPHLWRLLGLGRIEAVVEFHPPVMVADFASRKELAEFCYQRISRGVSRSLTGRHGEPETPLAVPQPEPVAVELPAAAAVG
ncbi:MAG TPA: lysophospholipid acyltransferase family protein [Stellaceae bacterium]|nr:lysophospholipid acyltransferase family protein [Stellaceae bacterium]